MKKAEGPGFTTAGRLRAWRVAALVLAASAAPAAPQGALPASSPVERALSALTSFRRNAVVRAAAGYTWRAGAGGSLQAAIWVAGEFDALAVSRDDRWDAGADVSVELTGPGESVVDGVHQALTRESRSFVVRMPAGGAVGPGLYNVRVTSKPGGAPAGTTETLEVEVPPVASGEQLRLGNTIVFRRGPFSGASWMPAADVRFRHQERVRVETAVVGAADVVVRLLDRTAHPLRVPVASSERQDGGVRIVSGEVTLAPLGVGDYLVETSATRNGTTRTALTAFRIVP